MLNYGFKCEAYKWFESYLSFHSQIVRINGCESVAMPLSHGVPQGYVFSIYLIGCRQDFLKHDIVNIYANDIQLEISFNSNHSAAERAVHRLEACMVDVHDWLLSHSLKLNKVK